MRFGYFTLSDSHYADNRRSANQLVADILDEAVADAARREQGAMAGVTVG